MYRLCRRQRRETLSVATRKCGSVRSCCLLHGLPRRDRHVRKRREREREKRKDQSPSRVFLIACERSFEEDVRLVREVDLNFQRRQTSDGRVSPLSDRLDRLVRVTYRSDVSIKHTIAFTTYICTYAYTFDVKDRSEMSATKRKKRRKGTK